MMMTTSTLMSFPPIAWWVRVLPCASVVIAINAPFRKMSWQNRYKIATANGPLLLSIPIVGGRTQRTAMQDVTIESKTDWQKQHWRSIFSAYGRAPFFEFYGPELELLFSQRFDRLMDFNSAALNWCVQALHLDIRVSYSNIGLDEQAPADISTHSVTETDNQPPYAQVFDDRHGFLPNLSILDLLLNEGPAAKTFLMK